jgi:PAS domain S-box-containing protein
MFNKTIKTLLIEDKAGDARLVREALIDAKDAEFELTHFERLTPALELLSNQEIDIVLLDLFLPDESGLKTLDRIHMTAPNVPIVVLTGMDDHDLALRALQEGAQDYLVKGNVESDLLSRSIRYAIERAQILASRRESEEKYRSLTDDVLDSSMVGIFILDSESRVVWVNKSVELYFGLSRSEIIGQDKKNLVHEKIKFIFDDPEDFCEKVLYSYYNPVQEQKFECHILPMEERNERWLEHFSQPIYSGLYAGGRIEHYTDITERKISEKRQLQLVSELETANIELKALSELKSRFVSMVSHEFRTPLTAIFAASDLLKRYSERMTDEQKVVRLDKIQREIKHMIQLLEDILIIGRAEAGKLPFKPEIIDLKSLCQEIIEEIKVTYDSTHEIIFSCIGNAIPVSLDEKIIRHIVTNLLSNAVKYSPNDTSIYFDLVFNADSIIFNVKDEGIGIPNEDLKRLFEPFHRATNVGDVFGTGLGLAIVKKAVDAHGGTITVNNNIDKGTTFSVTVPLAGEISETWAENYSEKL